jgi:hypothetical protein
MERELRGGSAQSLDCDRCSGLNNRRNCCRETGAGARSFSTIRSHSRRLSVTCPRSMGPIDALVVLPSNNRANIAASLTARERFGLRASQIMPTRGHAPAAAMIGADSYGAPADENACDNVSHFTIPMALAQRGAAVDNHQAAREVSMIRRSRLCLL